MIITLTLPPTPAAEVQVHAAAPERAAVPTVLPASTAVQAQPVPAVAIGSKWARGPEPLAPDGLLLQKALLDDRTDPAHRWPWYAVVAGAVWRWL